MYQWQQEKSDIEYKNKSESDANRLKFEQDLRDLQRELKLQTSKFQDELAKAENFKQNAIALSK